MTQDTGLACPLAAISPCCPPCPVPPPPQVHHPAELQLSALSNIFGGGASLANSGDGTSPNTPAAHTSTSPLLNGPAAANGYATSDDEAGSPMAGAAGPLQQQHSNGSAGSAASGASGASSARGAAAAAATRLSAAGLNPFQVASAGPAAAGGRSNVMFDPFASFQAASFSAPAGNAANRTGSEADLVHVSAAGNLQGRLAGDGGGHSGLPLNRNLMDDFRDFGGRDSPVLGIASGSLLLGGGEGSGATPGGSLNGSDILLSGGLLSAGNALRRSPSPVLEHPSEGLASSDEEAAGPEGMEGVEGPEGAEGVQRDERASEAQVEGGGGGGGGGAEEGRRVSTDSARDGVGSW